MAHGLRAALAGVSGVLQTAGELSKSPISRLGSNCMDIFSRTYPDCNGFNVLDSIDESCLI